MPNLYTNLFSISVRAAGFLLLQHYKSGKVNRLLFKKQVSEDVHHTIAELQGMLDIHKVELAVHKKTDPSFKFSTGLPGITCKEPESGRKVDS